MKDNYTMVVGIIGYDNAVAIDRELVNGVNEWVQWKKGSIMRHQVKIEQSLALAKRRGRPKKNI